MHQRFERVVAQHDAGHATGGVGARFHRHADIGLAQRPYVVLAVADHRDVAAAPLQRGHDPLFLLRRDPTEDAVLDDRFVELFVRHPLDLGPRDQPAAEPDAELLDECSDRSRVVAADDLGLDAEFVHELECAADLRPQLVGDRDQRDDAHRRQIVQLGVGQERGFRKRDAAQPARSGAFVLLKQRVRIGAGAEHALRRAQHEHPLLRAERHPRRAPAPFRVERHGFQRRRAVAEVSRRVGECPRSAVVVHCLERERAQPAAQTAPALAPVEVVDDQSIGRDRARFVKADRVDVVERFNRGVVLHECADPGDAQRADRERDGEAEQQTLWHDRCRGCDHRLDRFAGVAVVDRERDQEQRTENDRGDHQHAQDAPEAQL